MSANLRDESRRSRQECLRHVGVFNAMHTVPITCSRFCGGGPCLQREHLRPTNRSAGKAGDWRSTSAKIRRKLSRGAQRRSGPVRVSICANGNLPAQRDGSGICRGKENSPYHGWRGAHRGPAVLASGVPDRYGYRHSGREGYRCPVAGSSDEGLRHRGFAGCKSGTSRRADFNSRLSHRDRIQRYQSASVFRSGVAGDHGEPIAQYLQVGCYLVPNNLSANAHGNGYADPNIYIANVIESVQVDGGAFNVREGNHALNLGTTYALRSHLDPFFTLTGDQRDIAGTGGFSPTEHSWIALEASYGNGFLDRLEHRKQFKLNGGQVFHAGNHTLTLFGLGYYGFSYVAGLSPIFGFNSVDSANGWKQYPDTVDPRQKDQTHSSLIALNDVWKLGENQELQFSGFFRTYNLALYSNFGDGLIRQSEFRTVTGASAVYKKKFSKRFTLLAGTDYEREAPRRDDLDHYNFYSPADPYYYGPFVRVAGNNITITPVTPYVAPRER